MPSKEREPHHCIERDWYHLEYFTVPEYVAGMERGTRYSHSKARAFYGVIWTEGAPRVGRLTLDWQRNARGDKLRICDWQVYEAQVSELLGFDKPLKLKAPAKS